MALCGETAQVTTSRFITRAAAPERVSDDEVGGDKARSAWSERSEWSNLIRIARRRAEEEGADMLFVGERRRSRRRQSAIRAERAQRVEQSNPSASSRSRP